MDAEIRIVPSKTTRIKNFAKKHQKKVVIATLVVTTAGTALMIRNQRLFNEFLEEKGLKEEYYWTPSTPEEATK